MLGTASYISPEQASGAVATPLSDVYALGVVAYQCLSGRRPFEGDNPLEIAMKHVRDQPPPLPADIPPSVRGIVERAMAKDPAARFPTAAAFGQVARRTAGGLAGGTGALGPSGAPVSVPPGVPQTSPGPVGTGAVPRPPGPGTRVMPAYPTSPGPAATGTGGAFNRGSASVPPPPPPRPDTGYLAGPTPPGGGSGGRSTTVILGVLIGALVLLLLVCGGGWLLTHRGNNTAGPGGSPTPTAPATTARPSSTARLIPIDCENAKRNHTYEQVRRVLAEQGFKVVRQDVPGRKNIVVEVTPCEAARGDPVTVKVGNGQGTGGPTTDSTTGGGGGGGGDASPTPSCPPLAPGVVPPVGCPTGPPPGGPTPANGG